MACACKAAECKLRLENPAEIKYSSGIQRGKNDKVETMRIAVYASRFQDNVQYYERPSEDIERLKQLESERSPYVTDLADEFRCRRRAGRRDRRVRFSLAPELLTDDLSVFEDDPDVESYTAFSKMSDPSSAGMSQAYVASAITASGIAELTPLPETCYSLSDPETMTVQADSLAFLADPHASVMPYYALAFRLEEADADVVLRKKCFSIVAVRYENMMFGNWWYGGVTTVKDDATGETLERRVSRE